MWFQGVEQAIAPSLTLTIANLLGIQFHTKAPKTITNELLPCKIRESFCQNVKERLQIYLKEKTY